jgi:hypothetical protein
MCPAVAADERLPFSAALSSLALNRELQSEGCRTEFFALLKTRATRSPPLKIFSRPPATTGSLWTQNDGFLTLSVSFDPAC